MPNININKKSYDLTTDLNQLKCSLTALFASIPYNNYANNIIAQYEGYYASVIFTYLISLGFPCIPEDVTQKGRIDLTLKLPNRFVITKFKVDQKNTALAQIKQKKYSEKYLAEAKNQAIDIFILGIGFDSRDKNITEFDLEKVPC